MQSMEKMILEGDMESPIPYENKKELHTKLHEIDYVFHVQIMENLKNKIAEHESDIDNHVLRKYLWLKELLMWNMEPESSKIKFEYLMI